jgi:hypothetical protein
MVKNRRTKRPKAALLNTNFGPWFRKPLLYPLSYEATYSKSAEILGEGLI